MRKNWKKAFTLVELLAVIVLLGIIVAISMPSVNTVLNNAKKNAFIVDVKNYAKWVQQQEYIFVLQGYSTNVTSSAYGFSWHSGYTLYAGSHYI